ncbi:MAG: type II toxin-antitoxin system VapC family toxin [Cyclobacteriaceae bacterium]
MAQKKIVLCDTNILIELAKNNQEIIKELEAIGQENIAISAITAGEMIFGALNKAELSKIKKSLNSVSIIQVNEAISEIALELQENYSLSHNLTIPDALIAATALEEGVELFTLNQKDFKFISQIKLYQG